MKTNNRLSLQIIAFEFIIAMALALFIISSISSNFTAFPAVLSATILSVLSVPLSYMLYRAYDDKALKTTFKGLGIYFVIQSASGIIWYILPLINADPVLVQAAMFLMVVGYIPLLITLNRIAGIQQLMIHPWSHYIVVTVNATILLLIAYLAAWQRPADISVTYPSLVFGISITADIAIIAMSAMLIRHNLRNHRKYIFSLLFAVFALSLAGDSISAATVLGLMDGGNLAQLFYSVMLLLVTIALLLYSLIAVNRGQVERVNRELYDTRQLIKDMLTNTPDAMCITDRSGDVIMANSLFAGVVSSDIKDVIGHFNIFRDCAALGNEVCRRLDELREGKPVLIRDVYLGEGMQRCVYSLKMFPVCTSEGTPSGFIMIVENITDLERAREALKQANEDLESRVQARTRELAASNQALTREVAEKEVLLKEVHHRVKNNLQIISSLFGLQASSMQDEHSLSIFHESQNRIRSIALIHEKLYHSDDLAVVDFKQYVSGLTDNLYISYGADPARVRIVREISDVQIDIDTAIPCGLIINELISNCFKYAFPDGRTGEIFIGLYRAGDNIILEVRDNGVGLPECIDVKNTRSMGMQLVNVLIEQLGGEIEIGRQNGTQFRIRFHDGIAIV